MLQVGVVVMERSGRADARGRTTSFDRAAPFYEPTRRLADDAVDEVHRILNDASSAPGSVLEVGIGTGRIACHLASSGNRVVGVDISSEMLREARPVASTTGAVDLVVADARQLPIADSQFRRVIASLVLHVIEDWQVAVHEAWRVLTPDGSLLVDLGGQQSLVEEIHAEFAAAAGLEGRRLGVAVGDEWQLDKLMADLGAELTFLPLVVEQRTVSPTQVLQHVREHRWSWTWDLPDETMAAAAQAVVRWLPDRFDDPDAERVVRWVHNWRCYRRPRARAKCALAGRPAIVGNVHFEVHESPSGSEQVTVVLLHPLGCELRYWDGVIPLLTQPARVVAVDLPGHGRSGDRADWDLRLTAEIDRIADRLRARDLVVVGARSRS